MALKIDYDNFWIESLRARNYATGSLPAAGPTTKGAIYLDSTLNTFVFDNGTSLVTVNTSTTGLTGSLTSTRIPYATGSSTLADSANFTWDNTNSIQTIAGKFVLTGGTLAAAADRVLTITGKLAATASAETALSATITNGGASATAQQIGFNLSLSDSGFTTTTVSTRALIVNNAGSAGGGSLSSSSSTTSTGHIGAQLTASFNSTSGCSIGSWSTASGAGASGAAIGAIGQTTAATTLTSFGVIGIATAAGGTAAAGFFSPNFSTITTLPSNVALVADNSTLAYNIFLARDNGTNVFTIADGGLVTLATSPATMATSGNVAFTITSTLNGSANAETGTSTTITSSGSGVVTKTATAITFASGYTSAGTTLASSVTNNIAGTGNDLKLASAATAPLGNVASYSIYTGAGNFTNIASYNECNSSGGSSINIGVVGKSLVSTDHSSIGVLGVAKNGSVSVGGCFALSQADNPTYTSAALLADNGSSGSPVFIGRVNGSATFNILGNGIIQFTPSTPASTTLAYNGTTTLPTSAVAETSISETVTSAGTGVVTKTARVLTFAGSYTSAGTALALNITNNVAGTGADLKLTTASAVPLGNVSVYGLAAGSTATGYNIASYNEAASASVTNVGVVGKVAAVSATNSVGVIGVSASGPTNVVGGYFALGGSSTPTFTSAALIADNGGVSAPILLCRTGGATAKFTVDVSGNVLIANFATTGTVIYNSSSSGQLAATGPGTSGQPLISAGSSAPAFGNLGTSGGGTGLSGATPFTANGILYASSTSALATGSTLAWDNTNSIQTITGRLTITSGTLATTGFSAQTTTATLNGSANAETGITETITSGGTGTVVKNAHAITFSAGYTGAGTAAALNISNAVLGTGASLNIGTVTTAPVGVVGINAAITGSAAGYKIGAYYEVSGGTTTSVGVIGKSVDTVASATHIGVMGIGCNPTATSPISVGGFFASSGASQALSNTNPTYVASAVQCLAINSTVNALVCQTGVYGTQTTKFTVDGSGNVLVANFATAGTVVYNSSSSGQLAATAVGTAGQQLLSNGSSAPVWADQEAQARNWVMNGRFNIWQRNTSFTATGYTADRWLMTLGTGAAITCSRQAQTLGQVAVPGEPQYYLAFNRTTTGSTASTIEHRIEGVRSLAGKTIIASWYAKASAGTPAITWDIVQNFGTGGAPSTAVTTNLVTNEAITTSFVRYSHTITVPSISGKTIGTNGNDYLSIIMTLPTAAATVEIDIVDVQMEIGSVASVFEIPNSFQRELAACQRYHCKTFPYATAEAQNSANLLGSLSFTGAVANQTFTAHWRYPTIMRAAPSITTYCPNATSANWTTVTTTPTAATNSIGDAGVGIQGTTAVTAGSTYNIHASADAEL